ncbi:MAG TPA: hypothetical protein VLB79_14645 [Solirubrobacterales bacterium]|nr:hypothetical protein [Solirubrobacterales bacterium]
MTTVLSSFTPMLGHVAGVPVEETLPGVVAVGAIGARIATEWLRRRLRWRSTRVRDAGRGGRPG